MTINTFRRRLGATILTAALSFSVAAPAAQADAPEWPSVTVVALDNATAWVQSEVSAGDGGTIRIVGEGWVNPTSGTGSTIALKLNYGVGEQYQRTGGGIVDHPSATGDDTIWALLAPGASSHPNVYSIGADGSFDVEIDAPAGLEAGQHLTVLFQSGRFVTGDTTRALTSDYLIVGGVAYEPPPTEALPTCMADGPATASIFSTEHEFAGYVRLVGSGWCHPNPNSGGSRIAVKIDEGGYSRINSNLHANRTIWWIIQADHNDGSFDELIQLPSGTTSTSIPAFTTGAHSLRLLTGSLLSGDQGRTFGGAGVLDFVVGEYEPNDFPLPPSYNTELIENARGEVSATLSGRNLTVTVADGVKGDWVYLLPYYGGSPEYSWGWVQLNAKKQVTVDLRAAGMPVGGTKVAVLSGNQGEFGELRGWAPVQVPYFNTYAQVVPSPDLTGDGFGDLLAVDYDGVLWLLRGTVSGSLGARTKVGAGFGALTLSAPGDFNSDGRADILAKASNGDLFFYAGNGKGGFAKAVKAGWAWGPYDIIPAGDVTGDGIPDVLAIDAQGVLYYYAGNGKGGFTGKLTKNGQGWTNVDLYPAGDLNGDGNADILSIRADGTLHTHLGRGDGGFSKSTQSGKGWGGFELFAGSDGNGDGLADLYSRNTKGELFYYAGKPGGFRTAVKVGTGW